jgi:hypothetical protein
MAKKTITNSTSGIIFTTSNTNISQSIHTAMGTTSTTWHHNSNPGNQVVYSKPSIDPTPFCINFKWDDKEVDVTLKNGNDIFKLANAFMEWLDKNEIEYSIKTNSRKKKK